MNQVALAVVGLGYVGLPLAQLATERGLRVIGVDASKVVVNGLNSGHSHVDDISDSDVVAMIKGGFVSTCDFGQLRESDVIAVTVPTPLSKDGGPDLSFVISACESIAEQLRPGQLVILESTTYPGTTEEVVVPILESSGLRAGHDFWCAYSPERIDPGNSTYTLRNTPKIVGGVTPECTKKALAFYGQVVDQVVEAKGTREAELAKLLENTYRHVNIALVNELVQFCEPLGIDLWESIRCASTKPFGFSAFFPGPGVGGHCIPIDPNYLSHRVKTNLGRPFRFVELAEEINRGMPNYVVSRAQDILNERGKAMKGSRVLLLGVTYKADIQDQRESPAVDVATNLLDRGCEVAFHDPFVSSWHLPSRTLVSEPNLANALKSDFDLVILLQAHSEYLESPERFERYNVLDTRGHFTGPQVTRL